VFDSLQGMPLTGRASVRSLNVALLSAIVVASAALIIHSAVALYRFHDTLPFYDMILVDYQYLYGTWKDFWLFHDNEHRPLVVMPLYWLDLSIFRDQEGFLVVCNVVVAACIAAVPWRAIARGTNGDRALTAACCALTTAMMFWLANRANLSWPKQIHVYLSVFAMMLAFRRAADPRPTGAGAAAGIAAWLCVSTFSFGFGIIGFPAVAIIAVLRRWNWRAMFVLALALLACVALYAALTDGLQFIRDGKPVAGFDAGHTLAFALTLLSAPIVYIARTLTAGPSAVLTGQCLTVAGLGVYAWRTLRCIRRPPAELEAWALLLAAFAVGNALQTALARAFIHDLDYALEHRYIIGELPFWEGLILLAVPAVAAASQARVLAAACAGLAIEAGLLWSQRTELRDLRYEDAWHWQEAMSGLTGVPDRALFDAHIWIDADQVVRVLDGLRARRMSMFDWPQASWMGQPITRFAITEHSCMGELRGTTPVPGGDGSLALGWSGDARVADWSTWIVLADKAGTITGLARGGVMDEFAASWTHSHYSAWRGYVRGSADGLTPYMVLPGNRACALRRPW